MTYSLVPTAESLSDIYSEKIVQRGVRYQKLVEQFEHIYGEKPTFIARAPGRVNIIGEHIDYCGMPVFPMAIELDTLVAVRANSSTEVRVSNSNSEKYPSFSFNYSPDDIVFIDSSIHSWGNYFKCGYKGAIESANLTNPVGMDCIVDGHVPSGAGLSSSSALVSCTALATLKANNQDLIQEQIVNTAVSAERYVGVNGGGMDQTCSIMAKQSSAVFIEFYPSLRTTPVRFPKSDPEIAFVVANTFVVSDKQVTAPVCYNLRVVETRIASLILAKHLGLTDRPKISGADPLTMKIIMDELFSEQEVSGENSVATWVERLEKMLEITQSLFGDHPNGYTWEECADYLGIPVEEMKNKVHVNRFPVRAERLQLLKRTLHVYSETLRVVRFRQICESSDANSQPLIELGKLMNESQESCDKLFECSCPELNELCEIARKNGATGSRLTGAGWGGCTISMIPTDKADEFIEAVKKEYYEKKFPSMSEEELSDAIFSTRPGSGAFIYYI
ncbi:hypothetical protein BB559_006943 [Furculomyces boomerangus]|uniref:Galactokinase n=1 Tax=Furculomyces boomerangus TaxID=61424 RepID=A0A2T9XZW2_9FUNG|nr:hypothetical protein BB559_006943 [Furculomyces boomerangus]